MMTLHGVYDFSKRWLLVEMTLDMTPDMIDWFGFYVPEEDREDYDCAAPYMEQYLDPEGKEKLCPAWDEPDEDSGIESTRVAFFIEKGHGDILTTPYGNAELSLTEKLPARLEEIIEFEEM